MKTLKELRTYPDGQRWLCSDEAVAARHNLQSPFECGCRLWVGGGCVKIEFYSMMDWCLVGSHRFQSAEYVNIELLTPVVGETWEFDPAIYI